MTGLTILLLALSLAMDAMAVSVTLGICKGSVKLSDALKAGVYFGAFQAIMPALGYLAGSRLSGIIEPIDHWIAFALLAFIGAKMIYEAAWEKTVDDAEACPVGDPMSHKRMLVLAIATSIDALAAGISLALDRLPLMESVLTIGLVTFVISFAAVLLGRRLGVIFQKRASIFGGAVLILIGIKILMEHTI
ncbi:MAG: manganese efflux pump [Clostridiaceae bacterium]|nr:manganese efflux pump [Clostridiaceae bacterium]